MVTISNNWRMIWIWLTVGMAARTIQMSVLQWKRSDWYAIPLGLLAGLYVAAEIAEDYEVGDMLVPWMGMPIGFALVIAFMYKKRLLPTVTEGTLFGYGLVAGYIFVYDFYTYGLSANSFSFWILLLIPCFLALTTILIFSPQRVGKAGQTFLMATFIAVSIYIGYIIARETLTFSGSSWELVVIGYSYLALLANIFYLLYFIPIPAKNQSFGERMRNIRAHARDLEAKYIAVNSTATQIWLTLLLFAGLLVADYYAWISQPLLISTTLAFMALVHTPSEQSAFHPTTVQETL